MSQNINCPAQRKAKQFPLSQYPPLRSGGFGTVLASISYCVHRQSGRSGKLIVSAAHHTGTVSILRGHPAELPIRTCLLS
jgi:hypothetical protein